ncbi:ribosomal protein S12 methylthiotransferase accessory factor [Paenibacillus sp. 1_12]|uniref:TOMM precursor leader peptide-binding protein n=1 Tax=Paenibacillus sp. 1_12 TaxID=1566278 RepID=UPI0008EB0627|nr:TOMM precursor leader peptide-binding protein [Paenibacillus sp. 1_12]SFL65969.1 ribosomal protein S12 methylthiotransferase accessory factor [Paenibacillus sp. 1_12]
MKSVIAIVGEGRLAELVFRELSSFYTIVRQNDFEKGVPAGAKLVVVLGDKASSSFYHEMEEVLQSTEIPWISGFVAVDEGVVGPLVRPGLPGCSLCASMRYQTAGRSLQMSEQQLSWLVYGEKPLESDISHTGLLQMSGLLTAEVQRVLQGKQAITEGRIYFVNLKTLKSSLHSFLPDPLCPVCGRLPDDMATEAQINLQPSLKSSPHSYRSRSVSDLKDVLIKDYLDSRTGLFNAAMQDLASPFSSVHANLLLFAGDEVTAGRSHSYANSKLTAILEGLERYCSQVPRGKRTLIHDSYLNLAEQALHPLDVGVYSDEQYEQEDFPFQPFHPNNPINWVWGYSFLQERPILVPELLAYYSASFGEGYVNEASNGCALGSSLEEAILYGILEVVERDSFLITWYGQLPIPRLDPYSACSKELSLMIDRLRTVAGYEVHLFNMTMENGIPSVWVLAKNNKPTGANLICAAGAHLDPVTAAISAIHEMAGMIESHNVKLEADRESYMEMLKDSSLVRQMEDHSMLYCLPEAEERLRFLLDDQRPMQTFDEAFKQKKVQHTDLTDDLKDILMVFKRLKLDVIVVNQTAPETLRNHLHGVKVIIPGMLPMTFGNNLTRLSGLDRVLQVPVDLGFVQQPLTLEQLNPFPHPFP